MNASPQIDYVGSAFPIPHSHYSGPHAVLHPAPTCGKLRRVSNTKLSLYAHLFRRGCIVARAHRSILEHCAPHREELQRSSLQSIQARSERALLVRSIASSSNPVLVAWGRSSWVQYQGRRASARAEPNTRLPIRANNRSVKSIRYFHQSLECFGQSRRRPILRLRPIVRCAPQKCISQAIANGQAMRSLRSSLKFSNVIRCAT